MQTIRSALLTLAMESDDAQKQVTTIMESLFNLGKYIVEGSEEDKMNFLEDIMNKEIDMEMDVDAGYETLI
jgi:hypothetical protein